MKNTVCLIILTILLLGCTPQNTAPAEDLAQPEPFIEPTAADSKPSPPPQLSVTLLPSLPPIEEDKKMTPVTPPSVSPNLQSLIDQAKTDLAERFSLDSDQILVVKAESVVWPNSSLGCPQEGMLYTEVLTPGYLIVLTADAREYQYHASKNVQAFYCPNPQPPVAGTPSDN